MSNIATFKSRFGQGVRPNQFRVSIYDSPIGGVDMEFYAKATSIPASVMGNMDVPFRGRQLKVPGDRTFEDWTVTVFSDDGWSTRAFFELWMSQIQGHSRPGSSGNARSNPYGAARVNQLAADGSNLATYVMELIYPTNLAAIDLDWGTNDTPEEYQVTFAINNWYSTFNPEPVGNGSGSNVDVNFNIGTNGGNLNIGLGR